MLKKGKYSLSKIIFYFLIAVIILESVIFIYTVNAIGIFEKLDRQAYDSFALQIDSRSDELKNKLDAIAVNTIVNSKGLGESLNNISITWDSNTYGNNFQRQSIDDYYILQKFKEESINNIKNLINSNEVTGGFVIFNKENGLKDSPIIYLKSNNYNTNSNLSNNLQLIAGSKDLASRFDLQLSNNWSEYLENYYIDSIVLPNTINMSKNESLSEFEKGYWSNPFEISKDKEIITFTVPIRDYITNECYAIMGIEIDTKYFVSKLMSEINLSFSESSFFFGGIDFSDDIRKIRWFIPNIKTTSIDMGNDFHQGVDLYDIDGREQIYRADFLGGSNKEYYVYASPVNTNIGISFKDVRWSIIGFVPKRILLMSSRESLSFMMIGIVSASIFSIIIIAFIAHISTKDLVAISGFIREFKPQSHIKIKETNIKEIDELTKAIEILSNNLIEESKKMLRIITLSNIPLGFFELDKESNNVFITGSLLELLGLRENTNYVEYIEKKDFRKIIDRIIKEHEPGEKDVYRWRPFQEPEKIKWIKMDTINYKDKKIVIILDISDDILKKKQYEYELNHDMMTNLLNRKAFIKKSIDMISENPNLVGAVIFVDLDNLKHINDKYGHDEGDRYIIKAAKMFKKFNLMDGVVARVSSDEFIIFIYNFSSIEQARKTINKFIFENINDTINIGTEIYKIRSSIGISYYPFDSNNMESLLKFADSAMNEAKIRFKGNIVEFNNKFFMKNSYLQEKKEILNQLLEKNLFTYVFQSIIDIHKCDTYGYEALVRSKLPQLSSPLDILAIASAQSKLYRIEVLTMYNVSKWMYEHKDELKDKKIFINTIANQLLTNRDLDELKKNYGEIYENVIFEITEKEYCNQNFIDKKIKMLREKLNGKIAIDDFGSGYSNELRMIQIYPEVLKIDQDLIRDIDSDNDKKLIVSGIISYCNQRNIKVLTEGVETFRELETCIGLGAALIQGYYFSKPEKDLIELTNEQINAIKQILNVLFLKSCLTACLIRII